MKFAEMEAAPAEPAVNVAVVPVADAGVKLEVVQLTNVAPFPAVNVHDTVDAGAIVPLAGAHKTLDAELVTVSEAVPAVPVVGVAVIVVEPAATPVATPVDELMVATLGVPLDHVTVPHPVVGLLLASSQVALKACVAPTLIEADAGLTTTLLAAPAMNVTLMLPLSPT